MRHLTRLLVSAFATAFLASSALAGNGDCRLIRGASTPDDLSDDVTACRQDTWIHQGTTKLGNAAGFEADSLPSWNTTKPMTSVTGGAGGGYITNSIPHQLVTPQDPRASAVFQGTYTGVLDTIAVDLYALAAPVFTRDLNIALTVDNQPVFASNQIVNMVASGQAQKLSFAFVNLYSALQALEVANAADTNHTIRLAVNGRYAVNDPVVFVYDTSEVPSGLSFNLESTVMGPYTKIDVGVV
jgi:hypothetical protein